jgi:hypothetical protein
MELWKVFVISLAITVLICALKQIRSCKPKSDSTECKIYRTLIPIASSASCIIFLIAAAKGLINKP